MNLHTLVMSVSSLLVWLPLLVPALPCGSCEALHDWAKAKKSNEPGSHTFTLHDRDTGDMFVA